MSTATLDPPRPSADEARLKDYSLVGPDTQLAIERGLAEADWYTSPVPRPVMRELLERRDGPALRDCALYFGLLLASGVATWWLWGSWWALAPMMIYGVLYASASDARWHEAGHGTAFRTDWMNDALYEVASFMVLRESVPWHWSHTRHHSDTIIVGRDPEIAVPRPPDVRAMLLKCINWGAWKRYARNITLHVAGRVTPEEATYIPVAEYPRVFLRARIYAAILLGMGGACLYYGTWLPFVFVLGPNLYGAWLMPIYGWTQHTGLAENVLDHRLNCRTIHMHAVHRFLYWNMNYHLEHHMFPLVPYHQLPRLHEVIKDDCPPPYPSLWAAYREMVPAVLRQIREPGYYVRRPLPDTARPVGSRATARPIIPDGRADGDGWIDVCDADALPPGEVVRVDHAQRTYALYRLRDGSVHATDGMCTHGNTHLADGFVHEDGVIECPKHNGRFDVATGAPRRHPACVALRRHELREREGRLWLRVPGTSHDRPRLRFTVVSNRNVATFIKELVLEPAPGHVLPAYRPGQYLQLHIPAYGHLSFADLVVDEPYASVWRAHQLFDLTASNPVEGRRNYSMATDPATDGGHLRFNVRIATPPTGQACAAGAGSSWVWALRPGDRVDAWGPFGSFFVRESAREMVYIGGGAGMAPLRAHLAHLFETLHTGRTVSFWYGARTRQEIFYEAYFRDLERRFPNFSFHLVLSAPLPDDAWTGPTGFVHDVLRRTYLDGHPDPRRIEYYLCGPPVMVDATREMLCDGLGVDTDAVAFDAY